MKRKVCFSCGRFGGCPYIARGNKNFLEDRKNDVTCKFWVQRVLNAHGVPCGRETTGEGKV